MLKDYRLPPATAGKAKRAVIFLHGVGDRGDGGLLGIGQMWARYLPDCAFRCPDGPFAYDMAPEDFGGRQWFSLADRSKTAMLSGAKKAAPLLDGYIDQVQKELELTSERIALVGFSQGTMMALYVGFRRAKPVAGMIGYSGLLLGDEDLKTEMKCAPPVLLVHGTADEVVPFGAMKLAEAGLKAAGIPVQTLACSGTAHTIDDVGVAEGLRFIKGLWAD